MNCKIKALAFFLMVFFRVLAQTPAATIPEFSFLNPGKSSFTNKNLEAGRKIFFVFFDPECDHCHHAIQYINQHLQEFKKAAIYLVSLDNRQKISGVMNKYGSQLLKKKGVTFLQDSKNEFILKFKPRKYPAIFLYSAKKELMLYDDDEQNLSRFSKLINADGKKQF